MKSLTAAAAAGGGGRVGGVGAKAGEGVAKWSKVLLQLHGTRNKEQGKPRRLSMINNGCAIQSVNKKILSSAARDQNKAKQGKAKEKERER